MPSALCPSLVMPTTECYLQHQRFYFGLSGVCKHDSLCKYNFYPDYFFSIKSQYIGFVGQGMVRGNPQINESHFVFNINSPYYKSYYFSLFQGVPKNARLLASYLLLLKRRYFGTPSMYLLVFYVIRNLFKN